MHQIIRTIHGNHKPDKSFYSYIPSKHWICHHKCHVVHTQINENKTTIYIRGIEGYWKLTIILGMYIIINSRPYFLNVAIPAYHLNYNLKKTIHLWSISQDAAWFLTSFHSSVFFHGICSLMCLLLILLLPHKLYSAVLHLGLEHAFEILILLLCEHVFPISNLTWNAGREQGIKQ